VQPEPMEFDYEYHVTAFLTNFVEANRLVYRKILYSAILSSN